MKREILIITFMVLAFMLPIKFARAQSSPIYVALAIHSEDSYHQTTPLFESAQAKDTYLAFRKAILDFATLMHQQNIPWSFQSDWNFLNGALLYEVNNPSDADRMSITADTAGKNIVQYMAENLGVFIDPHSHENTHPVTGIQYTYGDVAYLATQLGVTPTGVVGGHVISGTTYQNWPRFKNAQSSQFDPNFVWNPTVLMGGGTGQHQNEYKSSGLWHPKEPGTSNIYDNYFVEDASSDFPAFGAWTANTTYINALITQRKNGQISNDRMLTATLVIGHQTLVEGMYGALDTDKLVDSLTIDDPNFVANYIATQVSPLLTLQSQGKVLINHFEDALEIWRTQFSELGYNCKQSTPTSSRCR